MPSGPGAEEDFVVLRACRTAWSACVVHVLGGRGGPVIGGFKDDVFLCVIKLCLWKAILLSLSEVCVTWSLFVMSPIVCRIRKGSLAIQIMSHKCR